MIVPSIPLIPIIPTWDILLIFFFLVSGFFYGLLFGRSRMLAITISTYVGIACVYTFPLNIELIENDAKEFLPIGVFIMSIFLTHFVFYVSLFHNRRLGGERWWQLFVLSFLSIGLIVSVSLRLLPLHFHTLFTDTTHSLFLSDTAYISWFVIPLATLLIANRKVE